jgi:hypothetical protein
LLSLPLQAKLLLAVGLPCLGHLSELLQLLVGLGAGLQL